MTESTPTNPTHTPRASGARMARDRAFQAVCIAAATLAILILVTLLAAILYRGFGRLNWAFIADGYHSSNPDEAGMTPPIVGSIWLLAICALTAIPLGVGTALLLEEYRPKNRWLARLHGLVQLNITNLAGVPSIVYGILGLSLFGYWVTFETKVNDPIAVIGETWYHQYPGAGGGFYLVRVGSDRDQARQDVPAAEGMAFLTIQGEDGRTLPLSEARPADVRVLAPDQIEPLRDAAEARIDQLDDRIKDQLEAQRVSRRGPVEITPDEAEAMARAVFTDVEVLADKAKLSGIATAQFRAMDGLESRDLRQARRSLQSELADAESAASGLDGIIVAGTPPSRLPDRAWYYFQAPFGRGLLAGGLTLMLVVLPVVIVVSQEAIRAVPGSVRFGALALGGTKWQAIQSVVLPAAIPGICTGTILAMSRAIGEAAPLLLLGAVFITFVPGPASGGTLFDSFSAMPLQIFQWTGMPNDGFRDAAAAGIIVLLAVLLTFNAIAVFIRQKYSSKG